MTYEEGPATQTPSIPHSREAEEAVIGSVMINPETYYDLAQFIGSDDFYIHRNRFIWGAFTRLHEKRIPVDFLTVCEDLTSAGELEEIGGSAYLTALITQVPSSLNAESYGRIVEGHSIRRKMINAANRIASLAYQENVDIKTAYSQGKKEYDESFPIHGEFQTIKEMTSRLYDKMDERAKGVVDNVIPTGFIDVDYQLDGGVRPGDLMYLGGRPGMMKTSLLLDIALSASMNHHRVGIFSLEMSNEQLTERLMTKVSEIPMKAIRTGQLAEHEWPRFTHAVEVLSDLGPRILMDDMPALTPYQFRAKAHAMYNRFGIDLLIVDYVQLMDADVKSKNGNRNNEISAISRTLKIIGRELNISVLAAAQLNRELEKRSDKRPILADLRDSGTLEQDADIVAFIYRDEVYNPNSDKKGIAEINIAKHRNGPVGMCELITDGPLMKFRNAATKTTRLNPPPKFEERQRVDIHGD